MEFGFYMFVPSMINGIFFARLIVELLSTVISIYSSLLIFISHNKYCNQQRWQYTFHDEMYSDSYDDDATIVCYLEQSHIRELKA